MSAVPPSPPWAITFASPSLPRAFRAASMPDATAAEFSNRECINGTPQADCGQRVVNTSRQPVASVVIMSGPAASSTSLAPIASPQPEHAVCPASNRCLSINLSSYQGLFKVNKLVFFADHCPVLYNIQYGIHVYIPAAEPYYVPLYPRHGFPAAEGGLYLSRQYSPVDRKS